ncbi:hypothetical protein L2E82_37376 [Cichorium intybus]|uniref:Uncharacterized protein n=1 Tax=Cichorium intybus TaxID=13427 RepID=A0ACB9AES8_CICIN|nr:hypothetical protein L2E82_37376 [Cichorium intybus]
MYRVCRPDVVWVCVQLSRGPDRWADEFSNERVHRGLVDEQWVNKFSKLELNEQAVMKQKSESSRGVYVFFDLNPYVGHPDPLREGQELFRKGLLSKAVLALEAVVLKNPDNVEGLRLLGVAHGENDDDQQS